MHIWYRFTLWSALFMTLVTRGQGINACVDPSDVANYRCSGLSIILKGCGLTDDDLVDLANCFEAAGDTFITSVDLADNLFEELPDDLFRDLRDIEELILTNNNLELLPEGLMQSRGSLASIYLGDNNLIALAPAAFERLNSLEVLYLDGNMLTTLPEELLDDLSRLTTLTLNKEDLADRTNTIQCLPALASTPMINYETPAGTCGCTLVGKSDAEADEILCGEDMTCQPGTSGYTCDSSAGGTGDPHMVGFSGQKFDFTGKDGSWYAVIKDGPVHVNMRVTAPLRELSNITYHTASEPNLEAGFPDSAIVTRTYITGISIMVADLDGHMHTIEIYVEYPHDLDAGCPVGVSPCLANGALTILVDDAEIVSPGEVTLGRGVSLGAVNLPGGCRPFGFERYWERKVQEADQADAQHGRRLAENVAVSMAEWILSDHLATNKPECEAYVADTGNDLFEHQSGHVSFQLTTPTFIMRLNYGKLHQVAVRDPTDQFDLPDHLTHQMNLGLSHVILGEFPQGILGETAAVRTDMYGVPIMAGITVVSGNEEDYKVEGPLGTSFKQAFI